MQTYRAFEREMIVLDRDRIQDCLVEWAFHVRDARHHICMALGDLEALEEAGERYDQMLDAQKCLAREAYLAVVNVGHELVREQCTWFVPEDAMTSARGAVARMLDALAPYVSRADTELRRIILDEQTVAPFLDGVSDAS